MVKGRKLAIAMMSYDDIGIAGGGKTGRDGSFEGSEIPESR